MNLDDKTTLEDILDQFTVKEIKKHLKDKNEKVNGTKIDLAKRLLSTISTERSQINENKENKTPSSTPDQTSIPDIETLKTGWTSESKYFPKISHNDIENYLLHSSHRTEDHKKMECYRQFIRGYNFFKEGYVHKVMINLLDDDNVHCYIRSKCHPSMKQGAYTQWLLLNKEQPFVILQAYCSCPAGLGEGCTHIAGLLFFLETNKSEPSSEEPCTSRPCQWSKPSKRKREADFVKNIQFKRHRYGKETSDKAKRNFPLPLNNDKFKTMLCCKLSDNNSKAVLLEMIPPQHEYQLEPSSDLNVGRVEEVETSENIICKSDNFIDVENLLKGISSRDEIVDVTSSVPPDVIEEIEIRTRGQCENGLWMKARKCRITSSIFHDVSVRRKTTPAEKLVSRIMGKDCETVDTPALRWGRKYEKIAKKRYVAHKKLFDKQRVYVQECGLFLCEENAYLGSSPDGVVHNNTTKEKKLLEIKCPYNARYKTVSEACEMSGFCCTFDEEREKISLKPNHRYYSQVQGQMAICKIYKCDFVIFTKKDFKIVEVRFDPLFWNDLKTKLHVFYVDHMVPALLKQ